MPSRHSSSSPPSSWRKASMSRNPAPPPSLSIVFAEPEQISLSTALDAGGVLSRKRDNDEGSHHTGANGNLHGHGTQSKRQRSDSLSSLRAVAARQNSERGSLFNFGRKASVQSLKSVSPARSALAAEVPALSESPEAELNPPFPDSTSGDDDYRTTAPPNDIRVAFPTVNDVPSTPAQILSVNADSEPALIPPLAPPEPMTSEPAILRSPPNLTPEIGLESANIPPTGPSPDIASENVNVAPSILIPAEITSSAPTIPTKPDPPSVEQPRISSWFGSFSRSRPVQPLAHSTPSIPPHTDTVAQREPVHAATSTPTLQDRADPPAPNDNTSTEHELEQRPKITLETPGGTIKSPAKPSSGWFGSWSSSTPPPPGKVDAAAATVMATEPPNPATPISAAAAILGHTVAPAAPVLSGSGEGGENGVVVDLQTPQRPEKRSSGDVQDARDRVNAPVEKSQSKTTSWFGSRTRVVVDSPLPLAASSPNPSAPNTAVVKEGLPIAEPVTANTEQQPAAPYAVDDSVTSPSSISPSPPSTSTTPTPSEPINVQTPPIRRSVWFAPRSPSRPPPPVHSPSVQSSIDDDGPLPRDTTTPMALTNINMMTAAVPSLASTQGPNPKLSSLNPTMSRFTLSLPLLGRAKMPLEEVLQAETSAGASAKSVDTNNDEDMLSMSTATVRPAPRAGGATGEAEVGEESHDDVRSTVNDVTSPSSASWWGYIGLGSSAPPSVSDASTKPAPAESTAPAPADTPLPQELELPEPPPSAPAVPTSTAEDATTKKSPSVRSEPAAGSGWWYNWYSSTPQPPPPPVSEEKTEAEMVKEEALARPDPPISTAAPAPAPANARSSSSPSSPSVNETANLNLNPIAATVSSNSKGWTSFFSSRALTTKMVTEKGEDGMEVMNLDDDEDSTDNNKTNSNSNNGALPSTSPPASATLQSPGQGQGQALLLSKTPSVKSTHSNNNNAETRTSKRAAPPAPLTNSESIKRKVVEEAKRSPSPAPSKKSVAPPTPKLPNLVLPTFDDTFRTLPRSRAWPKERERTLSSTTLTLKKTLGYMSDVLFATPERAGGDAKGKGKQINKELEEFGKELPRAWDVVGGLSQSAVRDMVDVKSCKKIVIIGIHGWYPGIAVRTVLGEPTGTSTKFASMMGTAVEKFAERHGIAFEDVVKIPLEGEGKIGHRVQKLYQNLTESDEWMNALHSADVIFVATHSQGCIVSTHLISRLISEGHIRTAANSDFSASVQAAASLAAGGAPMNPVGKQRVCLLALCGIHLGPLAYLHKSSLVQPYIQWFESPAASELFEFQDMDSQVSKDYVNALRQVLNHKVKMVYIASMNDQVVPIYSGSFTSVSHPLILRALYIDGDAYGSSDFLTNLLVLLLKIRNAGLSDGSLLAHLSEATAGSLNGVGHSTAYEELATFSLAVDYLFLSNDGLDNHPDLDFEPFNARSALNDYEIPWALRDLIADERVVYLFSHEFATLRDAFDEWQPRTTILRELKRKLEPIRRLKLSSRL